MNDDTTKRRKLGSVYEISNGRWRARISHGIKADGTRRVVSKCFDSRDDAEAWLVAKSAELNAERDVPHGVTLEMLWKVYGLNRLPDLAKTTQVVYRARMAKVLEAMGSREASSITHGDIQRMLDTMRPSVAKKTAVALSAVLTYATKNALIPENVMYKVPFNYGEDTRMPSADDDVWDADPFAAIESRNDVWGRDTILSCMERIRGLALEPVWLCCVGAGLRVEEAFALRKMDVRRIVASFDEYGDEIWVTQIAVHHATTREEKRKKTKTARSVGIVPMLEPFGERLWEIVQTLEAPTEELCKLSAARQNKQWRAYFEPPREYHKRMAESRKVQGCLYGLTYIPLSRMRATHTTLVQEYGILDSINQAWHRNTGAVQQRHYMRPDVTQASIAVSRNFI